MKPHIFGSGRRNRGNLIPPISPSFTNVTAPDIHYEGASTAAAVFTYSGTEPITVSHQWQTSANNVDWSNIGAATANTSPVWAPSDVGAYKRRTITLTSPYGVATIEGASSAVIASGTGGGGGGAPEDVGGWTVAAPVAVAGSTEAERMAHTQVGSRLYYIDPVDGVNPTAGTWANTGVYGNGAGEVYFWSGTNIVDSQGNTSPGGVGTLYGTDPTLPSASVKPFKTWSFVAPRQTGGAPGSASAWGQLTYTAGSATNGRSKKPDHWMFKRGTTIDMTTDYAAVPTGTNWSLSVSGGAGPSALAVVGAYGTGQRPKFKRPGSQFIWRWEDAIAFTDVIYTSLWFDGSDRTAGGTPGILLMYMSAEVQNLTIEDCVLDNGKGLIYQRCVGSKLKLRRCIIVNNYSTTDHNQGVFVSNDLTSKLQVEECILARNGFRSDPKVTWPQAPVSDDIFNRNLYLSGNCDHLNSWVDGCVVLYGASGEQPGRCGGMRVRGNFFLTGYISMEGKDTTERGSCGEMTNNVQQVLYRPNGNVFGGLSASYQIGGVTFTGNIVTLEAVPLVNRGSMVAPVQISAASAGGGRSKESLLGTRNNSFSNNIFWYPGKPVMATVAAGISNTSGYPPVANDLGLQRVSWVDGGVTYNFQGPGLSGNSVTDNVFVGAATPVISVIKNLGSTAPFNEYVDDTVNTGNTCYATEAEAITGEGYTDPRRTFKKYLETLGHTPTNEDENAVAIYIDHVLANMRKGQWDYAYTGKAMVNYVRAGFNLTAI